MSFWRRLLDIGPEPIVRESTHHIVDNDGRFEITLEYANQGFGEGWLELSHYYIDMRNVEHCEYRHVSP